MSAPSVFASFTARIHQEPQERDIGIQGLMAFRYGYIVMSVFKNPPLGMELVHTTEQWKCSHYRKELEFWWIFINMMSFPFPCTYFCYYVLLTNAPNTIFRITSVLLTHFRPFAQEKYFIKGFCFWILLLVFENTYLEEMVRNGLTNFCILETNPFVIYHTRYC